MPVNASLKSLAKDGRISLDDANRVKQLVKEGAVSPAEAKDAAQRYGDIVDPDARRAMESAAGTAMGPSTSSLPAATLDKTLQKGARGDDVKALQHGLMSLGMREQDPKLTMPSGVDGIYGNETKSAVSAFQLSHNLSATGVADPATLKAIDRQLRSSPQSAPTSTPRSPTTPAPTAPVSARPSRGLGPTQPDQPWLKLATAGKQSIAEKTESHSASIDKMGLGDVYGDHGTFADAVHKGDKAEVTRQVAQMTGNNDWAVKSMKMGSVSIENTKTHEAKTLKESSCIGWVMDNVKSSYQAAGKGARFAEIEAKVKAGGLRGTVLCEELQKDGWSAVFYSPRTAADLKAGTQKGDDDKLAALRMAEGGKRIWRETDLAGSTGVRADAVVSGYRDSQPNAATDAALAKIEKAPFFVGVANGGVHTFVGHDGQVSEMHWKAAPNEKGALQETQLRTWQWDTGLYMLPPGLWTKPSSSSTSSAATQGNA